MAVELNELAAITLAGSLAMERLVVIAKTAWPWLADPKIALPGESEIRVDKARRRAVLAITVVASMITAVVIGDGTNWYSHAIVVGTRKIHWPIFGLMISGGSAFWASIVGFASAAKDVRAQEKLQVNAESAVMQRQLTTATKVVPTI
jgi:hypothetical protein